MIAQDICFLIIGCDCYIFAMWICCNQITNSRSVVTFIINEFPKFFRVYFTLGSYFSLLFSIYFFLISLQTAFLADFSLTSYLPFLEGKECRGVGYSWTQLLAVISVCAVLRGARVTCIASYVAIYELVDIAMISSCWWLLKEKTSVSVVAW